MEDSGMSEAQGSAADQGQAQQEQTSESKDSGFLSEYDGGDAHAEGSGLQEGQKDESQNAQTEEIEQSDWYFDEGIQGKGDRPEYLLDKYQSVAEQAKAYTELQKKFGDFKGAPKDGYDIKIDGVDSDDPMVKHFSDVFKDMNMSQEGFEKAVNAFIDFKTQDAEASIQNEMKKLGPQGKEIIKETFNRLGRHLNQDEVKQVNSWMMTAEDVKLMNRILAFEPKSSAPTAQDISRSVSYESSKAVRAELDNNFKKYKEDENYRANLKRRLHDALVREGASTVPKK